VVSRARVDTRQPRHHSGRGIDRAETGGRADRWEPLLSRYAATAPDDPLRPRIRAQLVNGYLPLARHIATRYNNRGEAWDDLFQVASLGLLHAIDRFDPDQGHHFLSFAVPTITGEVRRHFRDTTWSMRVPRRLKDLHVSINDAVHESSQRPGRAPRPSEIAARLNITTDAVIEGLQAAESYRAASLDAVLDADTDGDSRLDHLGGEDPGMELFTNCHCLAPELAKLPERERAILVMRFYDDMTQSQISERIGLSQMHVSRLLTATLARLRDSITTDRAGLLGAPDRRRRD
jgi:RNA polymerase sigma-B factor